MKKILIICLLMTTVLVAYGQNIVTVEFDSSSKKWKDNEGLKKLDPKQNNNSIRINGCTKFLWRIISRKDPSKPDGVEVQKNDNTLMAASNPQTINPFSEGSFNGTKPIFLECNCKDGSPEKKEYPIFDNPAAENPPDESQMVLKFQNGNWEPNNELIKLSENKKNIIKIEGCTAFDFELLGDGKPIDNQLTKDNNTIKIESFSDAKFKEHNSYTLKAICKDGANSSPLEYDIFKKKNRNEDTESGSLAKKDDCKNCGTARIPCPDSTCVEKTAKNNFGMSPKIFEKDKIVYVYDFNKDPSKRGFYKVEMVSKSKEERKVDALKYDEKEKPINRKPIGTELKARAAVYGVSYTVAFSSFIDPEGKALVYELKGKLPAGISFDITNLVLSGTPTQTGEFPLTLTATDPEGLSDSKDLTLTVNNASVSNLAPLAPILKDPITNLKAIRGSDFSVTFPFFTDPENRTLTYELIGKLPDGIGFERAQVALSGIPMQTGEFPLTLSATDPGGLATSIDFKLIVDNSAEKLDPLSTTDINLHVKKGSSYFVTFPFFIHPKGQPLDYKINGKLPDSFSFDRSNLTISGTPTQTGTFRFTLTATDPNGLLTGSRNYILQVSKAAVNNTPPIAGDIPNLKATKGSVYKVRLPYFIDPEGQDLSYTLKGTLPEGIIFDDRSLVLMGTPTQSTLNDPLKLTLTATDVEGLSTEKTFDFKVNDVKANESSPIGANIKVPVAVNGIAYSYTFPSFIDPEGQSLVYTLNGSLPAGLSFAPSTLLISGTPTQTGPFDLTLTATDPSGLFTPKVFKLTVNNASVSKLSPVASELTDLSAISGTSFRVTFPFFTDPEGQSLTYVLNGSLPTGLTFNTSTLILSGTPTQLGTFPLTLIATDPDGLSAKADFKLEVKGNTGTATGFSQLQSAMEKLDAYNASVEKEALHYKLRTSPVNMNKEALSAKNNVQIYIANVNRFFYDVTLNGVVKTFESDTPTLFKDFFIGGDLFNNVIGAYEKSIQKDNGEPINVVNLVGQIQKFIENYNRLQGDKLKAYNPCVYFDCCVVRDYADLANQLLKIKVELAKIEASYLDKVNKHSELKTKLESCDTKGKALDTFRKDNKTDLENIAKKQAAGTALTEAETKKLKELATLQKASDDCKKEIPALDEDFKKLDNELKPYRATVELHNSLPKNEEIEKLIVFLEQMTIKNQAFVVEQPTLNGNRLDLDININSKDAVTETYKIPADKNTIPTIEIPIIKRPFVSFSTGAFIGLGLYNKKYDWQSLPNSSGTVANNDKYILTESAYSVPVSGFSALANLEWKWSRNIGMALSTGVGLTIEKNPRYAYLLGGSLTLGNTYQFVITGGVAVMQMDKLKNNFQAVFDERISYSLATKPEIEYYKQLKAGPFVSISFTPFKIK